ncbi:hypothetical protein ACJX0J_039621, partial [Zea mays]
VTTRHNKCYFVDVMFIDFKALKNRKNFEASNRAKEENDVTDPHYLRLCLGPRSAPHTRYWNERKEVKQKKRQKEENEDMHHWKPKTVALAPNVEHKTKIGQHNFSDGYNTCSFHLLISFIIDNYMNTFEVLLRVLSHVSIDLVQLF